MRVVRRFTHVLVIVLTLVVGATAAVVIVSQTAWFKNWLRGYIVREADNYLNGDLTIGRLGGNLFFGVELEDIGVSMDGTEVVAVKDVGLDYNIFQLIAKGLTVDEIRLNQPVIYLRRDGQTWSLARLIKRQAQEADREGPAYPMTVDAIGISDASIVFEQPVGTSGVTVPQRFDKLDARMSFKYEPVHYSLEIDHVSFRATEPGIALNALSGGVAIEDDTLYVDNLALRTAETSLSIDGAVRDYLERPHLSLEISSDKLSLPELSRLVPALDGIALQPAFELKLNGLLDDLGVDANVRSSAGAVTMTGRADVMAPGQAVMGDISVRHLNLAPILKDDRQKTDLTADLQVDIRAEEFARVETVRGSVALRAPRIEVSGYAAEHITANARLKGRRVDLNGRASAYGAQASVTGQVILQSRTRPLSYDLKGRADRIDLRRLPSSLNVPPAESLVNLDYHVRGAEPPARAGDSRSMTGDFTFRESTVAGARIANGSTASLAMQGTKISYSAELTVANLNLERVGREFNVPALATARYESMLNGRVRADGSGTNVQDMRVTADGTLTDSTILGGRIPELTFVATVADDVVQVDAKGGFDGFDPAVLSGRPAMKGTISGSLDIDATLRDMSSGVTPDSVEATGTVALQPSTVGGLQIERANVDADYRDRGGEIRQLEIVGRDVNVRASGTFVLNDTGESNLTFHADTPSLEEVGALFDVPLAGMAKVDGTLTGNRRELQAAGTLVGSNIEYQENGALSASSKYAVRVPDLAFDRAQVEATTDATFVTVAGQNINEVSVKTTYADKQVVFDGTARQPERSLDLAGELVLHPEHQEVHLERLGLDTRGTQWQLAPGTSVTIQYGGDVITVKDLQLISGEQRIEADGTIGRPGEALQVGMTNVGLESIDALLLRPPQFSGRLNAAASVSGTTSAPAVEGQFTVADGAFRKFTYESLTGTVDYAGQGLTVDARLQQNPTQWITAKGYVPVALFSRPPADTTSGVRVHVPAATPEDRIDLTVDSSPIDLGIIQGFTTALTEVTGTVETHLRVTGSAADPHPTGTLLIQKGEAEVVPVGVRYRNITGRVDFDPERVRIEGITLLDNHESELTVSGELAVHEREVGAVQIRVTADDFKVIDNEMGNVRVRSDLTITGELRAPRIEGELGVTTGDINLDEIIALTGTSPYRTAPTEFEAGQAAEAAPPAIFDNLRMDVRLTVPDDLVVKASSLQTPGSPIGLGALNVTLGGDLRATKEPGDRLRIVGTVNTVRGHYDFQGRRFEILRDGTVQFQGLDELNPRLDIRTRRLIRGVEARVNVRGPLREPEIQLSSTPPLEEADILSLIVFNQPINQLGEGQQISLAARAQALAAGAVASQIAQSIGGALELDTFEINLAPETGGGPQLTFGQQVGQNLYVRVQQGVGEQNSTNFMLEYELTEWLRLRTNVVQNASSTQQSLFRRAESTGLDLIFFFSY